MNFDDIEPFNPNKLPTWNEFIKANPKVEPHLNSKDGCPSTIFVLLQIQAMLDDIYHVVEGRIKLDDLKKKYCE